MVPRAPARAVSALGVVPTVGSPQAPGAEPLASAPPAAGRGQCLAAGEPTQPDYECGSSGWVLPLPVCLDLFTDHFLGSCLPRPHISPGSPWLPLPSN